MPLENGAHSSHTLYQKLVTSCSISATKDALTVEFADGGYDFHSQWLHDARCDRGIARTAATAFSQKHGSVRIEEANISGTGIKAVLVVTWDDKTSAGFPVLWLRVLAPIVARQHDHDAVSKAHLSKGWQPETLVIPEVPYNAICSTSLTQAQYTATKASILDTLLLDSAPGIIKVTGLPTVDIETEQSQKNNLVTQVLKKLFGSVFTHPLRDADTTFKVTTHYQEERKNIGELPNYNPDEVLLPHVDHAHYQVPVRVQGWHVVEGESENTFVSGIAAVSTLMKESPDLFEPLCKAPMAVGRVARHYNPHLYQAAIDPAITMEPGSSSKIKRIRWHPHLTGYLLTDFNTYEKSRYAHEQFQQILRRDTHQLKLVLKPGDMYLWDNFRILHGRERVLSVPRTGVGQTVLEQVVDDQYRAMKLDMLRSSMDIAWLVHLSIDQLNELTNILNNETEGF